MVSVIFSVLLSFEISLDPAILLQSQNSVFDFLSPFFVFGICIECDHLQNRWEQQLHAVYWLEAATWEQYLQNHVCPYSCLMLCSSLPSILLLIGIFGLRARGASACTRCWPVILLQCVISSARHSLLSVFVLFKVFKLVYCLQQLAELTFSAWYQWTRIWPRSGFVSSCEIPCP